MTPTLTTDALVRFCWDVPAGAVAHVIRDDREWDALEPEWDHLFAQSPAASPPLRFRWLRDWWRVYGPTYGDGGRGLRILTVRRGPRLIGVLPLYENTGSGGLFGIRRLQFVSTGEAEFEETCAEYLDLLHAPGEEATCVSAIGRMLEVGDLRWGELDLCDLPANSPLVRLVSAFQDRCRTAMTTRGGCAIANISGGLDAYLARLSANRRQQSRRLLRAARRAGATLEVAGGAADACAYFEQLVELHQRRWTLAGRPGCFSAERFTQFHHGLARAWVPGGQAVLARLVLNGVPLAVIYGFVTNSKFDFYQSGVLTDGAAPVPSPGIVAFLMLMSHLSGRGVERFDFLRARGHVSYKHGLSTDQCPLARIVVVRPTVRGWVNRRTDLIRRACGRVRTHLAATPPTPEARPASKAGRDTAVAAPRRISRTDLAAGLMAKSGIGPLLRSIGAWRGALVLAYHRIGDGSGSAFDRALWSATAEDFDAQIALLKRNVDVIGPDELPQVARRRRGRCAVITFDDGYRDNYETAFPILKSHGVPALFLVSTGFLDHPRLSWWDEIAWMVRTSRCHWVPASKWLAEAVRFDDPDRERAIEALLAVYKSLPGERTEAYLEFLSEATGAGRYAGDEPSRLWMTWDMAREMSRQGMSIGGHTVNHPVLSRVSPERQQEEITGCARRIAAEMGQPMRWLSYPRGKLDTFNDATRACLKEAGVELAFSAYGGLNRFDRWDAYDVRRSGVEMNRSPQWLKLAVTLPQIFT